MPLAAQVLDSGMYQGAMPNFSGTGGPIGRRMNNDMTRKELGWSPKYESFRAFIAAGAPE